MDDRASDSVCFTLASRSKKDAQRKCLHQELQEYPAQHAPCILKCPHFASIKLSTGFEAKKRNSLSTNPGDHRNPVLTGDITEIEISFVLPIADRCFSGGCLILQGHCHSKY
jgi:hypothetical protein